MNCQVAFMLLGELACTLNIRHERRGGRDFHTEKVASWSQGVPVLGCHNYAILVTVRNHYWYVLLDAGYETQLCSHPQR